MKWIALILMTMDHVASYLYFVLPPWLMIIMRCLGRAAMPVFVYSLVIGYHYTRSVIRYLIRLLFFAILTDAVFQFIHHYYGVYVYKNVLFTLAFGVLVLLGSDLIKAGLKGWGKKTVITVKRYRLRPWLGVTAGIILIVLSVFFTIYLKTDYGVFGLGMILVLHLIRDRYPFPLQRADQSFASYQTDEKKVSIRLFLGLLSVMAIFTAYELIFVDSGRVNMSQYGFIRAAQLIAPVIAFSFIGTEKEQKKSMISKYFFYFYYPLHLSIIMYLSAKLK